MFAASRTEFAPREFGRWRRSVELPRECRRDLVRISSEVVRSIEGVGVVERPFPRVFPDGVRAWFMEGVGVVERAPPSMVDEFRL